MEKISTYVPKNDREAFNRQWALEKLIREAANRQILHALFYEGKFWWHGEVKPNSKKKESGNGAAKMI